MTRQQQGRPERKRAARNATPARARRDFLKDLGVRPVINGAGTYTMLSGSVMLPEVVQAMTAVSRRFVRIDELHDAVGRRIASLLRCEAAMVTSGAFGALTLGTAACITGTNPDFIRRLPDIASMRDEVIIQKSHRFSYDHAVRNCGVRLIEVETAEQLERAVNERTAMLLFLNKHEPMGKITAAEFIRLGRQHGVPTFNDAAADLPPVGNLFACTRMGFDLVAFSGGKGMRGPQSAGLLLGRESLIRAARLNTTPQSDTLGRGLKVGKEEMVGMLVAVERYLERDHAADWREWERRIAVIAAAIGSIDGVTTEPFIPRIANQVPHLRIRWAPHLITMTPAEAVRRLHNGTPPIEVVPVSYEEGCIEITSWTLLPGEAEIVARRIREVLTDRGPEEEQ